MRIVKVCSHEEVATSTVAKIQDKDAGALESRQQEGIELVTNINLR